MKNLKDKYFSIFNAVREIYDIHGNRSFYSKWNTWRQQIRRLFEKTFDTKPKYWKDIANEAIYNFLYVTVYDYLDKDREFTISTRAQKHLRNTFSDLITDLEEINETNRLRSGIWENYFEEGATEDAQRLNYRRFTESWDYVLSSREHMPDYDQWKKERRRVYDYYMCLTSKPYNGTDNELEADLDYEPNYSPQKSEINRYAIMALAKSCEKNIHFDEIEEALMAKNEFYANPMEPLQVEIEPDSSIPIAIQEAMIERNKSLPSLMKRLDTLDFVSDDV